MFFKCWSVAEVKTLKVSSFSKFELSVVPDIEDAIRTGLAFLLSAFHPSFLFSFLYFIPLPFSILNQVFTI